MTKFIFKKTASVKFKSLCVGEFFIANNEVYLKLNPFLVIENINDDDCPIKIEITNETVLYNAVHLNKDGKVSYSYFNDGEDVVKCNTIINLERISPEFKELAF